MKKEYFNIPNLMGYFRICMIPVFLFLYSRADSSGDYAIAFAVLALSLITDMLDGKIARKFNMVTDFGKMLDPVADKLTQGALALAVTFHYPFVTFFLILFLCKELYMSVMGLYLKKKKGVINGALLHGKVCTVVIDMVVFALLLFRNISYMTATVLILAMSCFLCYSWIRYILFHISVLHGTEQGKKKISRRHGLILFLFIMAYLLLGATLPYIRGPEVSREFKETFSTEAFYGDEISCDRAAVIEDNGIALQERIRMIEHAKHSLILSTFDFRADTAGKQVIAALCAASDRGVSVKVLMDGFNFWTHMEGNPYFYALMGKENVEIRIYNKLNPLLPWRGMSRMHDKYLIADEDVFLLGGRNTFNYFLGDQKSYKNYDRDILVYNTGGSDSSLYQVLAYFEEVWNLDCTGRWDYGNLITNQSGVAKAEKELESLYQTMKEEYDDWFAETDYRKITVETKRISLLSNPTNLYGKEPRVFYGLCKLMEEAKESVCIHTPYIICDEQMYRAFRDINRKNVDVTLMTNSAENNGNPFGAVDYALHKKQILDTGLSVLEYTGGVSYHGKSLTIDDDLAIVGSFNMDMKSAYQDTELMLVVDSEELNTQLKSIMEQYHKDSRIALPDETEADRLPGEDAPFKDQVLYSLLKWLNPCIRFLF